MFQPGDLVVYGPTGVCRVEAVTCPKPAQQLLHSELSVALGIPCEEVPDYIARRVEAHKSTGA